MKRWIFLLTAVLFLFPLSGTTLAGIPGTPDRVPAATLVVPFFEKDKSGVQDTLLVVTNTYEGEADYVHWEVWDRDGNLTDDLYGNFTLGPLETWARSMTDIISNASASTKAQLTVGNFYQGFVTFDVVTEYTDDPPIYWDYPFASYNDLEGYIYYVRLPEGSSNGLNMIPIEYVGPDTEVHPYLTDFYQIGDGREEIASDARACAEALIYGYPCPDAYDMHVIDSRVFLQPNLSAESRIILFVWAPYSGAGGPSVICDDWGDCPTTYPYVRYDEDGNIEQDTTIRLDHVVNVINVSGTENGWVSIYGVPSGWIDGQIYAFSFNSASSPTVATNWDAIFESNMIPSYGMVMKSARASRSHGGRLSGTFVQP